jgi:hypothetical protein
MAWEHAARRRSDGTGRGGGRPAHAVWRGRWQWRIPDLDRRREFLRTLGEEDAVLCFLALAAALMGSPVEYGAGALRCLVLTPAMDFRQTAGKRPVALVRESLLRNRVSEALESMSYADVSNGTSLNIRPTSAVQTSLASHRIAGSRKVPPLLDPVTRVRSF